MLELGDCLRTWRLLETPRPGRLIEAERLADHRKAYLDYEGPLSDGRGQVTRWDAGTYEIVRDQGDSLMIKLMGTRVLGPAMLEHRDAVHWSFYLTSQ